MAFGQRCQSTAPIALVRNDWRRHRRRRDSGSAPSWDPQTTPEGGIHAESDEHTDSFCSDRVTAQTHRRFAPTTDPSGRLQPECVDDLNWNRWIPTGIRKPQFFVAERPLRALNHLSVEDSCVLLFL